VTAAHVRGLAPQGQSLPLEPKRTLEQEAHSMAGTSRTQTSVVALMAVFGLGICFVIVGAISEEYKAALGLSNADLGT